VFAGVNPESKTIEEPMKHGITPHDLRRLAVATKLDPRAVLRCLAGEPVRRTTRTLVARAARELGVTIPTVENAAA
jgi:hypothetical protein